jgi:predicted nucleic acid-binding protein
VKAPQDQGMIVQLLEEIDLGEAESIVLAMEEQAKCLIIDEYKGRMIADSYGIKIVGILGVLIQAKQKEAISAVKPHIDQLIEIGSDWTKN